MEIPQHEENGEYFLQVDISRFSSSSQIYLKLKEHKSSIRIILRKCTKRKDKMWILKVSEVQNYLHNTNRL